MKYSMENLCNWRPPDEWVRITTIDAHTAGEPLRIITGGFPQLQGDTILDSRAFALEHMDHLRTALMWEPRGHADMYGCIVTPAMTPEADFGVLFLHNEGYSSMCGHGIIAVTTVAVETGMVPLQEPYTVVKIDTPAGLVSACADIRDGRVCSVRFQNVPSFVVALDDYIEIPGLGRICFDIAFGGAYYAFVDVADVGLKCAPEHHNELIVAGKKIKRAVTESFLLKHPFESELDFLYGTIFIGPPENSGHHSRNVCIFAEGEVDRSPTGTGVSARMALHVARGEVKIGEEIIIESIIGSTFTGRALEEVKFGSYEAIIPEVGGKAFIIGRHEFIIDPDDPLRGGFLMR